MVFRLFGLPFCCLLSCCFFLCKNVIYWCSSMLFYWHSKEALILGVKRHGMWLVLQHFQCSLPSQFQRAKLFRADVEKWRFMSSKREECLKSSRSKNINWEWTPKGLPKIFHQKTHDSPKKPQLIRSYNHGNGLFDFLTRFKVSNMV